MDETEKMHNGILRRCPVKKDFPDFPCPGHYKHSEMTSSATRDRTVGRAKPLYSIAFFSDLRCVLEKSSYENGVINGTIDMLKKLLIRVCSKNVDKVVQLGGLLNSEILNNKEEVNTVLSALSNIIKNSYLGIAHVLGDQEAAIKKYYMQSDFGQFFESTGMINQPNVCCGVAYYADDLGSDYKLVVLDGYELLIVDPNQDAQKSNGPLHASGGLNITLHGQASASQKCFHCQSKVPKPEGIGWTAELQGGRKYFSSDATKMLPRLRSAISEHQLRWLSRCLQDAVAEPRSVVVACHAPLHPLLVCDQTTLLYNWSEVLRLLMNFNCVRLVVCGRPLCKGSQPPDGRPPYQLDHDILYYSMPPVGELTQQDNLAWGHLVADLGFDFIRVHGEGVGLSQGWTLPFEPKRKLSVNYFDYAFNRGFDA